TRLRAENPRRVASRSTGPPIPARCREWPQSHADAKLARTLGNSIRNHAENASACQSQADDTEDAKEKRSKSWVSQFVFHEFVQGADERNRLTGIHRTYRLACRSEEHTSELQS